MDSGKARDANRSAAGRRFEVVPVEESLINHLSLPSQLPQHEDTGIEKIELELLSRLQAAAFSISEVATTRAKSVWLSVCRSLAVWKRVTASGRLDKTILEDELRQLSATDFILLYIRKQNAAVFIYRSTSAGSNEVVFEVYEASPKCEDVLAAKSALQWDFPGSAVSIPYETFLDSDFLQSLSSSLEQASSESVKEFAAHTNKSGYEIVEDRDTNDPALISSVLVPLLEANGQLINPVVLRKRVRDDVLWHNAARPWRRLPLWLVIRVAVQRHLMIRLKQTDLCHDRSRVEYKFFVCYVLAKLLNDVRSSTTPDRLSHLNAKLCRRMVKLESELQTASEDSVNAWNRYFNSCLGTDVQQSVGLAKRALTLRWDMTKESEKKTILPLPGRAEREALILTCAAGSRNYLHDAIARFRTDQHVRPTRPKTGTGKGTEADTSDILDPYFKLADVEEEFCTMTVKSDSDAGHHQQNCVVYANKVRDYIGNVGTLYDCSVEQKSVMLLTVMDCWVRLDQAMCDIHPLLEDFHPGVIPELMDVLHIAQLGEMDRLKDVQEYIQARIERSGRSSLTIFDDPQRGCFAERFADETPGGDIIRRELNRIRAQAAISRHAKEEEWARKTEVYEDLTKKVDSSTCMYVATDDPQPRRGYANARTHDPRCPRCALQKRLQHLKIEIFEDYLPSDELLAKVAVFELQGFPAFEAYRDLTWFIIAKLGAPPTTEEIIQPKCSLRDFKQLQSFSQPSNRSFRLVSTTKSFLKTHYAMISLPVAKSDVLRPHGLRYAYFDQVTATWAGRRRQRPTFAHLCALDLPASSPLAALLNPIPVDKFGPSSYEVMASQSACGAGVNMHEWLSVQSLLSGSRRRWITLLTELGSSNINFSTEAMAIVVNHVALQAGPRADEDDVFRKNHGIFDNESFCQSLFEQILQKLEGIATNWREVYCMEIIITIALRLSLVCKRLDDTDSDELYPDPPPLCLALLMKARGITLAWLRLLRDETKKATDAETAKRFQVYALWAALLCKRTIGTVIEGLSLIDAAALSALVECSIALQDNLAAHVQDLSDTLKGAIIRDAKIMFQLEEYIQEAIGTYPHHLLSALSAGWPEVEGQPRKLTHWALAPNPGAVYLTVAAANEHLREQQVEYNYRHGILLVDGMPVGKLPSDHSTSAVLQELFGNQSLLTYPSNLKGMQYTLCISPHGNQVHVGFAGERMIVRVRNGQQILEFIPREVFGTHQLFDLPGPLLINCIHWFDLQTGKLEIRPRASMWQSKKDTYWHADLIGRCTRTRGLHKDTLIDPHARLFHRVARNLEGLEMRHQIVVYARLRGHNPKPSIMVDLPRLQLSFFVKRGALQCPQLQASVCLDQDIGTWYGLQSKLVLESYNSTQRMVLVPFGDFDIERDGDHVKIQVHVNPKATSSFGKFSVNDVLGRIECAPEPMLVYTKAYLHAVTSHPVPDHLTGKTGSEEALHWLSSGVCQPWAPLRPLHLKLLSRISKLTPKREYYPETLKHMKKETWDPCLTTTMQHDAFGEVVKQITDKSDALSLFALQPAEHDSSIQHASEVLSWGDAHLNTRAWLRWQLTHRTDNVIKPQCDASDILYASRDRGSGRRKRMYADIYELGTLIRTWPSRLRTERSLAASLSHSLEIEGFSNEVDKGDVASVSDRLNMDLKQSWGTLVSLARRYRSSKFALMFLFAPMCYKYDMSMDLMRTILAFAVFDELATLDLPAFDKYERYRRGQRPRFEDLMELAQPARIAPPRDELEDMAELGLSNKMQRQMRERKQKHERMSDRGCEILVRHLLSQWPCAEPSTGDLDDSLLVDISLAMDAIRPEWTRLFENATFDAHIDQVQEILGRHYCEDRPKPSGFVPEDQEPVKSLLHVGVVPCLEDLMKGGIRQRPPTGCGGKPDSHPSTTIPIRGSFLATREDHGGHTTIGVRDGRSLINQPSQGRRAGRDMGQVPQSVLQTSQWTGHATVTGAIQELNSIVKSTMSTSSRVKKRYGEDLLQSIEAFRAKATVGHMDTPDQVNLRAEDRLSLIVELHEKLQQIDEHLSHPDNKSWDRKVHWLKSGLLWPATTPMTVLEQLRSTSRSHFGSNVKEHLVWFGLAITDIQRQLRLNDLAMKGDHGRYTEEINNKAHSNWKPTEYPDWLLLEIESNLLIRPGQVDVALATISPASGANSVLQMNMGQGKTSCVIPMVAVVVANGRNLARVVVPKALLQQTAQLLHQRLGGLLGRELRHIPFSRKTPTNAATIGSYHMIQQHMLRHAGVMLCLPEHNMSFMLSGLQQLLDSNTQEARMMIKVQRWINSVSRDVLDESDYTLAVRTQLIYPSGGQTTVDGHPHRWLVAQALLKNVRAHLSSLKRSYPRSIEVVHRSGGGYPILFIQRNDVEEELLHRLTTDIYNGRTDILPVSGFDIKDRVAIKEFITNHKVRSATLERIEKLCPDKVHIRQTVYLLRGLLVNRILLMTLKKRWNVQYGLHPTREPIAVPFHAKGVPSDQSEFGHPDVAILLTCLSFYYDGIGIAHLKQSLEHVLKSDDPASAYDRWTQSSNSFPDSLREWNSINTDDEGQLGEIWRAVRYNVVVIDYFLNNFVFPRHAKQFKVKLQSNGWDIPLLPLLAEAVPTKGASGNRGCLTTGFSGTNDNRTMLPLTIKQQDLPGLHHTNAEVLTYLLHQRNRGYAVMATKDGKRLGEESFLHMLRQRKIKVLIDAGAQIVEMDNLTLIRTWLEIDTSAPAGLYFDDDNKPWIYSRNSNTKTPLLASSYADGLHECLIYLDEAHTRGTDLKLPQDVCGALTLGPGQTKDHTVQAAMRLRQLGTTQSVVFFAPPEVHQSILDLQKKVDGSKVDSHDVIAWLLDNTCDGIETLQPLYFAQGADFCKRMQAAIDYPEFLHDKGHRDAYVSMIRQEEQQTLKQLYGPKAKTKVIAMKEAANPLVASYMKELHERRKGFQDTGRAVHASALQEVEQEREVEMEVESVQQVKKANHFAAHNYPGLHKDLKMFAQTGRLPAQSLCCSHIFHAMSRTGLGRKSDLSPAVANSQLHVSAEFEKTVKLAIEKLNDSFLRPVNWILWSEVTETAIIIIPEESENVIPIVSQAEERNTYLLTYAAPITRKMLQFNDLRYFTIPTLPRDWRAPQWLKTELGLFAGRLYFEWDEYQHLARYFATADSGITPDDQDWTFIDAHNRSAPYGSGESSGEDQEADKKQLTKPFVKNPLIFMQEWLAVRRRGQDFAHTPMGYITQSKQLYADHPFFRQATQEESGRLARPTVRVTANHDDPDEVVYEAGIEDIPLADDDSDSTDESEIEYGDDELYPSEEEDTSDESRHHTSSAGEGQKAPKHHAKGRASRGKKGR